MSWDALDPRVRAAAEQVCTEKELAVVRLYAGGMGYRTIARALDIDRDTARSRLSRAARKIREVVGDELIR